MLWLILVRDSFAYAPAGMKEQEGNICTCTGVLISSDEINLIVLTVNDKSHRMHIPDEPMR